MIIMLKILETHANAHNFSNNVSALKKIIPGFSSSSCNIRRLATKNREDNIAQYGEFMDTKPIETSERRILSRLSTPSPFIWN